MDASEKKCNNIQIRKIYSEPDTNTYIREVKSNLSFQELQSVKFKHPNCKNFIQFDPMHKSHIQEILIRTKIKF